MVTNEETFDSLMSVEQALALVEKSLRSLATENRLIEVVTVVFGPTWDAEALATVVTGWERGDFSNLPIIEIRPAAEIYGLTGCFSGETGCIYLSAEYVDSHAQTPIVITQLILEEVAQFIEAQIKPARTFGKAGRTFRDLVLSFASEVSAELTVAGRAV